MFLLAVWLKLHSVVGLGKHSTAITPKAMASLDMDEFNNLWSQLVAEQPIRCSATSVEYPGAAKPSLAILTVRIISFLQEDPGP
jgi:hypothetical protein